MNQVRFAVFLGLLLGSGPLNAQLYLADKIDIDAALSAKPETVSLPVGVELISVQPPGPADALGDDGIQLEYLIWEGSFEGASLPPGWISNTSQNCQWAPTTVDANIGSYSVSPVGGGAGCAGVPGASYPNNMQSFLYYGPFDLSDPDLSSASFKGSLKRDLGLGDTVYAAYSADCNTGWQGYPFEGAGAWTAFDLPLDALLGDDSVCVAFIFLSDESAQANAGVLVDDVLITRSDDLSPGDLSVQSVSVPSGPFSSSEGIVIDLVVENVGTETTLPYNLDFYRSADSIVNESDVYIGTLPDRDALDSGAQYEQGVNLGSFPVGDWWIGAITSLQDTDNSNNTNSTDNPVTVSNSPKVLVSPASLIFVESPASTSSIAEDAPAAVSYQEIQQSSAQLSRILQRLEPALAERGTARILVGLDVPHRAYGGLDRAGRQSQQDAINAVQDVVLAQLPTGAARVNARFRTIPYLGLTVNRRALEALLRSPRVRSVEEDSLSRPAMDSSNGVIGAPVAWSEGYDGAGWAVAVLDSGVDVTHPWFTTGANKIVAEACYSSSNGSDIESTCPGGVIDSTAEGSGDDCSLSIEGCGHGTHVAGTVAGNVGGGNDLVGVAPGADIIAINVFHKTTDSGTCDDSPPCIRSFASNQVKGLERVLLLSDSLDIAAANMSLGGGRYFDQASCDSVNGARKLAIDNLRGVGIATVISAGNGDYTDSIGSPGCISSAISVGATTDSDNVASFSNIYPELHLLAPGVSITSAYPPTGTAILQGTSMAAPHVAGAWAVLKQINPAATVDQVLSSLQSTATPVNDTRVGGIETGLLRINLDLAIDNARTSIAIRNIGLGPLEVDGIALDTLAPWISWTQPSLPLNIPMGGYEIIPLTIDFSQAPEPSSVSNIRISHNDSSQGDMVVTVTVEPSTGLPIPTNVTASTNQADRVAVNWDAVTGASYYELHRCDGPSTSECTETIPAEPSNNFYNDNPPAGTTFYYRVKACDAECSDFSEYAEGYRVPSYSVGGSVNGYLGSGLSLNLELQADDDQLEPPGDGDFTFGLLVADGGFYEVTVFTQPGSPNQICGVTNGTGTIGGMDVTDVMVSCETTQYSVGGVVEGLAVGNSVTLQNNSTDDKTISYVDGSENFTFDTPLDDGSDYMVTVLTQPSDPDQTCSVSSGGGALSGANVTAVKVTCAVDTFTVGGTVTGLSGAGLQLLVNGGDAEAIDGDGAFEFDNPLADGSEYVVTVGVQPSGPDQICSVSSGQGTLSGADVTDVLVTCADTGDEIFSDGFEPKN